MQLDPDLNLEKAKKMAGQQETICDQSRKLKKEEGATVDAVSSRGLFSFKQRPKQVPDKKHCTRCGGGHPSAQQKRSFATIVIERDTIADSAFTGRTLQSLTWQTFERKMKKT